jgi:hypothetical protein
MKLEELNYTDVCYLIEALEEQLGAKTSRVGTYRLALLRKLERNKRVLFDEPTGCDTNGTN